MITYTWRGDFLAHEVEDLHSAGFQRTADPSYDWRAQVDTHSLGWVCARDTGNLVGWVNLIWDGATHAFVLDTVVAVSHRRMGVGSELVLMAREGAARAGCEWLHVDFEPHLTVFYLESCGFSPTDAGLVAL